MQTASGEQATRLLSLEDLQERSDVSRHTWRLWLRQGKLPAVRLGRRLLVAESDYERYVSANRSASGAR
jgi:excisionase family DNA binding protein